MPESSLPVNKMATKTRFSWKIETSMKTKSKTRASEEGVKSSHLNALMMLGSQLLSTGRFNGGLPSFVTRGLDSEQIWQQLELRNEHKLALTACTKEIVSIQRRKKPRKKLKIIEDDENNSFDNESDKSVDSNSEDSDNDVNSALDSIKKRLTGSKGEDDDEFVDFDDSDEEDELDFDFAVEKELSRGLSDHEDSDEDPEGKSSQSKNKLKKKPDKRTTVVDDKFFKMADMEEFLDAEDQKEERRLKKQNKPGQEDEESSDEEEDEEIDMFAADSDDDGEAEEAKYSDFFDPVEGGESNKENHSDDSEEEVRVDEEITVKYKKKSSKKQKKKNALESDEEADDIEDGDVEDIEMDDDEDGDVENSEMEDDEDEDAQSGGEHSHGGEDENSTETKSKKKVSFNQDLLASDEDDALKDESLEMKKQKQKSTFEMKQEKLKAKAREMEELSLRETPWELTGETSSMKRPENSLLETVLDFQHTTRAAPVITDDTTKTLEDFIKQRIKDKTFDDVERKEKPKEDVFEFKKRIVLDQEKSKLSLGELYEQEFLKQQQQDTEEVKADPECEKIESELKKLFFQLDALSNFRYTPMKPGTEVKVIVNTPAIAMEEVAPVATADSDLLAPQEVREKKKGDLKADDERDATDKKRARRQNKLEKREKKKAKESREKLVDKLKPGMGNKYSKQRALKQLEEISKSDKNVTLIQGNNKKLGSSTAFFSELQDEVQTKVKAKKGAMDKKKKKVDPSKLML